MPATRLLMSLCLAWSLCGAASAQSMTFVLEPFPPFIVYDRGSAEGPFPEIVRAVCDHLKVHCKLDVTPWRRAIVMAEMGAVDGIVMIVHTPEREKDFHFTDPVLQTSYALFARQASTLSYTVPKDLNGYTVAAYGPSSTSKAADDIAKLVPNMRLEIEVDNQAVLRKLDAGRYPEPAAALINRDVGLYMLRQQKITSVIPVGDVKRIDYSIALSRKRVGADQAAQFNRALHDLVKKGVIKAIADKYGLKAAP